MPTGMRDAVVVVTGASSGIGRATALAFARAGARVVLAARRAAALAEAARECDDSGTRATAVPTDVTDEAAVARLAHAAVARFGRIDVWVNNAGVYAVGRFDALPGDVFRRVVETNLFGCVHGAREALRQFRTQGHGVLINVASMVGRMGSALTAPYTASKFAVVGLSEVLRQEVRDEGDVHVCTVLPASIDTPLFQHAANYTGRPLRALRPVYAPERVADVIVRLARDPEREVMVGGAAHAMAALHALAPAVYERLVPAQVERDHFDAGRAEPQPGNLFAPVAEGASVGGGWRAARGRPLAAVAVLGAVPFLVRWLRPRLAAASA